LSWSILPQVELEVELPGGVARRRLAIVVHEGQTQLDDPQQVDVAAQQLVVVVRRGAKFADRASYHARELGVHCHIVVLLHHLADCAELLLQVMLPHVPDAALLVAGYVDLAMCRATDGRGHCLRN